MVVMLMEGEVSSTVGSSRDRGLWRFLGVEPRASRAGSPAPAG